jgi:hypothetical protein
MKRQDAIQLTVTMMAILLGTVLLPASAFAQNTGVVGAGAASLPANTLLSGVPLSGLFFGMGVVVPGDTTADGQFQARLLGTNILGQPQNIEVQGDATSGTLGTDTRTFSGTATVDMGDGTAPLSNVPFTVTASATSLLLILGATSLPAATLTAGNIAIK